MTKLLDLCYDVLLQIVEEVRPEDLAACAQTSHGFRQFITHNSRLFKTHYLKIYDDPRKNLGDPDPDWAVELQRLIRCQKILESADNDLKHDEFNFIATTFYNLITTASIDSTGTSRNQDRISHAFLDIFQNHDAFLCRSSLFAQAGIRTLHHAATHEDRQLSAKMHCLFGIPSANYGRLVELKHARARSRVYDLRNYTDKTRWGPFQRDGSMSADWEMLECLMIDLEYAYSKSCRRYRKEFRPPWREPLEGIIPVRAKVLPQYPTSLPNEPEVPLRLKDPYNITGIWSRLVCFLDYNVFFTFNFSADALLLPADEAREPLNIEEAMRHIIMDLHVTAVELPDPTDSSGLPVVQFAGTSHAVDVAWDPNANSRIRGSVRLTSEGEVHWQTISTFNDNQERWRSEGIQIGGIRSERGVLGTWFDKDYDPHGPAGPTAFWKISDMNIDEDMLNAGDANEFYQ